MLGQRRAVLGLTGDRVDRDEEEPRAVGRVGGRLDGGRARVADRARRQARVDAAEFRMIVTEGPDF